MKTTPRQKVCMFVFNNFTNDSRVQKEAVSLIEAGFKTTVMAVLDRRTLPCEIRNNIQIVRIPVNPWDMLLPVRMKDLDWLKNSIISRANKYSNDSSNAKLPSADASTALHVDIADNLKWNDNYSDRKIATEIRNQYHNSGVTAQKIKHYLSIIIHKSTNIILRKLFLLINRINKLVIKCIKFMLMPFYRPLCLFAFSKRSYSLTSDCRHDVYHAHDLNMLPLAYFAARRDKSKLVYDSHELYVERNKLIPSSRIWKYMQSRGEHFLVHRADAVITVNESLANEMSRRYKIAPPDVIMNTPAQMKRCDHGMIGNGRLRAALPIAPHHKLLIYVGGITFNRGLEVLIQSLRILDDCFLVCMGYGNDAFKQKLAKLSKDIHVQERFSFFGPVPTDEVVSFSAGAELGVAPIANACMSYYYCSPNKLFEYMNAGLPVIASNFPELEKVVLGHGIGLTFNPSDPSAIARTARQILDNPEVAAQMRQNALEASKQYNWENEARKLIRIYEKIQCA